MIQKELKDARKEKHITIQSMAHALNLPVEKYQKLEEKPYLLTVHQVIQIAHVLNIVDLSEIDWTHGVETASDNLNLADPIE